VWNARSLHRDGYESSLYGDETTIKADIINYSAKDQSAAVKQTKEIIIKNMKNKIIINDVKGSGVDARACRLP
jgi:hypothetical protein